MQVIFLKPITLMLMMNSENLKFIKVNGRALFKKAIDI